MTHQHQLTLDGVTESNSGASQGRRLFADAGPHRKLELLDSSTDPKCVTIQKFSPAR